MTRPLVALLAFIVLVTSYAGYRWFWFLTDDAFIAFRYVSNSIHGHGYVWNATPFAPVEGYTSFLWVLLLDIIWRVAAVEPPEVANGLAYCFGLGSLGVTGLFLRRLELPASLASHRLAVALLVFLGILSNRTFLTWLSSGLETAMFNFWVLTWVYIASTDPGRRGRRWLLLLTSTCVGIALTRPGGLLFMAATLVIAAANFQELAPERRDRPRFALSVSPLLIIGVHVLWRYSFYGDWLPNTYYAKHIGAWPAGGVRYLFSFIMEFFWWGVLCLAIVWIRKAARVGFKAGMEQMWRRRTLVLALGAVAAHAGYYTLIIGGDHFEYRVYSQLVPLLWLATAWLTIRLFDTPRRVLVSMVILVTLTLPIQWAHWGLTHELNTRKQTWSLRVKLAPIFPSPLRPYVRAFDNVQDWLIRRYVCVRRTEHAVFREHQMSKFPRRSFDYKWEDKAVAKGIAVGIIGWVLPEVYVIDIHGLNDYVVARTGRLRKLKTRKMAHELFAPAGYVECFRPNVVVENGSLVTEDRDKALTDDEMRECLRSFRELIPPH